MTRPTREEVAEELGLPPDRVAPQVLGGVDTDDVRSCVSCGGRVSGPRAEGDVCSSCMCAYEDGLIEDPRRDGGDPEERIEADALGL